VERRDVKRRKGRGQRKGESEGGGVLACAG